MKREKQASGQPPPADTEVDAALARDLETGDFEAEDVRAAVRAADGRDGEAGGPEAGGAAGAYGADRETGGPEPGGAAGAGGAAGSPDAGSPAPAGRGPEAGASGARRSRRFSR
jgi:hypothetical protein